MVDPDRARERVAEEESREELKDRLDREHSELIEELRSLIPGAEVLFGLLLAIRFTEQFAELDPVQRDVYYATLVSVGIALVLFLAPATFHRLRFRTGDKEYLLQKGNREAIAGSAAMALAFTGVLFVVTDLLYGRTVGVVAAAALLALIAWLWWAIALYRVWRVG